MAPQVASGVLERSQRLDRKGPITTGHAKLSPNYSPFGQSLCTAAHCGFTEASLRPRRAIQNHSRYTTTPMTLATKIGLSTARLATPLGEMIAQWNSAGLYSLDWKVPSSDHENCAEPEQRETLQRMLDDYFSGGRFSGGRAPFDALVIDSAGWTEFQREVYRACRAIPSGQTASYGELARRVGSPGASRAVGAAMAANRLLLVIPCHRVVAADGKLRGFSAPGGLDTKRLLLDLESRGESLPLFDDR